MSPGVVRKPEDRGHSAEGQKSDEAHLHPDERHRQPEVTHILVADDDPEVRLSLAAYLHDSGYRVSVAADEAEAIALFVGNSIDLVLLDWRMPGGGGAAVLPELTARAPTVPVIVVSGMIDVHQIVSALQTGAWDFIPKPILDLRRLEETVERCLQRAELLRQEGQRRQHLESLVLRRTQELEVLNRHLRKEIDERREFELALGESEGRFRQLVENISEAYWVQDVATRRLLYVSPACGAVWGMESEALYANARSVLETVHPDDCEQAPEVLFHIPCSGRASEAELRVENGEGGYRWVRLRAFPVRDACGNVYRVAGVAEDVTDRHEAEERILRSLREKDTLLREVHHRVKNNLQLVASLLNLQADHVRDQADRGLFVESRNRIISMSLVHEELYRSGDLAGVNFAEYITKLARKLVTALSVDADVRLDLTVDPLFLPVDTAIPCGLIINELVTNALKHAYRGRSGGMLRVLARQKGTHLLLAVEDDGPGLPAPLETMRTPTLGLELVRSLAAQLGATLDVPSGTGTRIHLLFALPEA